MAARTDSAGFTLIELLVVITLIAVIAGVAGFAVGGSGPRRLQAEADELRYRFNHLADRALMKQQLIRWRVDPDSRQCETRYLDHNGEWMPLETRNAEPACAFSAAKTLSLQLDEPTPATAESTAEPWQTLYFLPAGDYTAFSLTLRGRGDYSLALRGDGVNPVQLEGGQP